MDDDNSPGMIAFRAFEKERQKDFADSIDVVPIDISALRKAMSLMVNEDIRFIPVIACAFADDHLEAMFKKFLPDNVPGGKRRMLEGSISNLFNRIQFAFAFDMVHPDVLQALDKLRGYRNKIAHTWDQDTLPDFVETPLPNMDDLEAGLLHIDIKDGGDGDLTQEASFRLRTVWLLARLFYESRNYTLARRAKLDPYQALYGSGSPRSFGAISTAATMYTQLIFRAQIS